MIDVRYSRVKFAMMFVALAGAGVLGESLTHAERPRAVFAGYLVMAIVAWGLPYSLRYLASSKVLSMDHRGMTVHGFFGAKTVAWRELEHVSVWEVSTRGSTARHLYLHVPHGLFGRFRLSEALLAAPHRTIEAVCEAIEQAQTSQPSFGRAAAPAVVEPVAAPAQRAAGFGRKGLV